MKAKGGASRIRRSMLRRVAGVAVLLFVLVLAPTAQAGTLGLAEVRPADRTLLAQAGERALAYPADGGGAARCPHVQRPRPRSPDRRPGARARSRSRERTGRGRQGLRRRAERAGPSRGRQLPRRAAGGGVARTSRLGSRRAPRLRL